MITTTLIFWLVALTIFPQSPQSCNGECQDGYRSVCVKRGSDCKCTCIKDVASGVKALRELLEAYNVSSATINEAENRYRDKAGSEHGEFSFTVYDPASGEWLIRAQGLAGIVIIDTVTSVDDVSSASVTDAKVTDANNFPPRKKIRVTKKSLKTKKRVTKPSP